MITIPLWMQATDAQLKCIAFCNWADLQSATFDQEINGTLNRLKHLAPLHRDNLKSARPFGWSEESVRAVTEASASIPPDTILNRHNLSDTKFFWWFEQPLLTSLGEVQALYGSWRSHDKEHLFVVTSWYRINDRGVERYATGPVWNWQENETVSNLLDRITVADNKPEEQRQQARETINEVSKFVLAAFAWLDQKILTVTEEHGERHARKRYQKVVKKWHPVLIVQLRKREYQHDGIGNGGSHAPPSYRFVVNGHWRNQPCGPANSDRKLIYIMPFVKGPEDAPFRPRQKVYEVTR